MSILVVDESTENRQLLGALLRWDGHEEIREADSAEAAFEQLQLGAPEGEPCPIDLVLMELRLPGIDGVEACRRLKADPRLTPIPVIMVTSCSDIGRLEEAFAAGARDYIQEPVNRVELLARVRAALSLKTERDRRGQRERELLAARRELESVNARLERLAVEDALTSVANRHAYEDRLDLEWRRGIRERFDLSLLVIDVDHFKEFNDVCGHHQGDECLQAVARVLDAGVRRPADLLARYGGEEFVAILPRTAESGALHVAEMMRRAVKDLRIAHPGSHTAGHVTVSIGCATVRPRPEWNRGLLFRAADAALYVAKRGGRDRTSCAELSSVAAVQRFHEGAEAAEQARQKAAPA